MKYFKLLAALFCFISIQAIYAQSEKVNSEQIIVRMFESGGFNPSMILVSYGDDNIESVDLRSLGTTKNWRHNLNILHTVLDRVRKQGYTIVTTTAVGGDAFLTTTYIFLRNDMMKDTGSIDR